MQPATGSQPAAFIRNGSAAPHIATGRNSRVTSVLRRISRGPRTLTSRRTDLPRGSTGGDYLSADNGSHHRQLWLYSNHPAGMTLGASRTAIFGHVTEGCDLTITGGRRERRHAGEHRD